MDPTTYYSSYHFVPESGNFKRIFEPAQTVIPALKLLTRIKGNFRLKSSQDYSETPSFSSNISQETPKL